MPSLQSHVFRFVLEHRHLLRFQLKRRAFFDENTSIAKFREDCEKGAAMFGKVPEGIETSPIQIEGVPAEWILPTNAAKDRVILYTHGGGYVSGSITDHRNHVARFVHSTGVGALLFEYRLAPEHTYPAAIEDSLKVYRWLLAQGVDPAKIMIVGDSAGGGLCLAMLVALRDQGIPLPAGAVAISPWTDLACTGESYHTKNKVSLAPLESWTVFSKYYVGDHDPRLPWISPLYADLHGLPPIFIASGEDDELIDDSTRFAEKARMAGVDIRLKVGERMVHCYPLLPAFIPEAREAMEEICAFIRKHIGK